jgi:hypothetical protein
MHCTWPGPPSLFRAARKHCSRPWQVSLFVQRFGFRDMTNGTWSEDEPPVDIASVDDLERFIDFAEKIAEMPTAISVKVHGYRVDLLAGHNLSFVHLTPDDHDKPYYVTVGGPAKEGVDFWLHSWHHTWFENRHLVPKALAREAFRVFFETGHFSPVVKWEQYFA